MNENIITAVFGTSRTAKVRPRYRYCSGQVLILKGIRDLPDFYEVHFANIGSDADATPLIGTAEGVEIPDSYLETGKGVMAYIVVHNEATDATTIYTVTIPVIDRPRPAAVEPTEEEANIISQAIVALNETTQSAEEALEKYTNMGAVAETLEPGTPATAEYNDGVLKLGIPAGATGVQGPQGVDGATGNGIASIAKTSTDGSVDTYTITYTNGTTSTFTVTNGVDGAVMSVAGKTGAVTLGAGDVAFDDQQAYNDGTVGAGLTNLKSQTDAMSTATATDVGKALSPKTVTDGKVTEWKFVPAGGGGCGTVDDVQVNGVSVVTDGVANVPLAGANQYGVVKTSANAGTQIISDAIGIAPSNSAEIKNATVGYKPITPIRQHEAAFFGFAKAAGDNTQSESANAVGNYTEAAKSAISEMLGGSVAVTGTTPSISALPGVRYVCGEVSTIDITIPATGIIDVVFTSGSTPAVLTVTPPSGVTMKWANGFDPTTLEVNTVYEINVMDGCYGVVGTWT